jgi:hypothetical protein
MVSKKVHFLYMLTWVSSLLLVAAFGAFAWQLYALRVQLQHAGVSSSGLFVVGALAFVIVLAALILGVYTILQSHRMIGSAYHIASHLERIIGGQTNEPLQLRDGDYFTEIAELINRLREAKSGAASGAPGEPPKA